MAERIFKGQTALTLRLDTEIDLTTATDAWMKYKKPNGTIGQWDAIIDSPTISGKISYIIQSSNDLDQVGEWTRWAYIEIGGTKYAPGDSVTFEVYEEGS